MEVITELAKFFTALIGTESWFVFFASIVLILLSLGLKALWVSHMNMSITLKRKELGMNEVDQSIEVIYKLMHSHYLTLAKSKFGSDYFNMKETAIYRYLIIHALGERKPEYRARIRRNHFNEKDPSEWSEYVKDCITDDINAISRFLDVHYHPQARIPRPEVYEWNVSKLDEIKHEIDHLFSRLLKIAEDNKLKKFFGIKLELGGV